jgi:ABC-type molybdenum transport system ATPase subunit/photorepair protein PhrA
MTLPSAWPKLICWRRGLSRYSNLELQSRHVNCLRDGGEKLTTIRDAAHQAGLHVVIYGERGVGKTSLANVVRPTIWALDNYGKEPDSATNQDGRQLCC